MAARVFMAVRGWHVGQEGEPGLVFQVWPQCLFAEEGEAKVFCLARGLAPEEVHSGRVGRCGAAAVAHYPPGISGQLMRAGRRPWFPCRHAAYST